VYHFELRKFPHTVSRFNQGEQEIQALVVRWVAEEWIEVGERKWNVHETKLTVLEGPELSLPELAMNRGWRNAMRRSEDVTERVLAAARAAGAQAAAGVPAAAGAPEVSATGVAQASGGVSATGDLTLLADSLGLEVLGTLDAGPAPLARVWRLAHERLDGRSPSESLALAELAVRSLLDRGLVVVQPGDAESAEAVLDDVQSWTSEGGETVAIARSG
jgi:hypothetical protein